MALDPTILREIESAEFALKLGLSGSRIRAMQALVHLPQARALLDALREDADSVYDVACRVVALIRTKIDLRYTHPGDAAIAVYLRALNIVNPSLAEDLVPMVASQRQNLWWSVPVIDRVLREPMRVEGAAAVYVEMDCLSRERQESVHHRCFTPTREDLLLPPRYPTKFFAATFDSDASQYFVDSSSSSRAPRVSARAHDVEEEAIAL